MIDKKQADKLDWIIWNADYFQIILRDGVIEYSFTCYARVDCDEYIRDRTSAWRDDPTAPQGYELTNPCWNARPEISDYLKKIVVELPNLRIIKANYSVSFSFDPEEEDWDDTNLSEYKRKFDHFYV